MVRRGPSEPTQLPVALTEADTTALGERAADRHDWIREMGRPARTKTSGPSQRTAEYRASPTDPDASPLRPSSARAHLGYHDHDVVDGGKARIILTAMVTPASVQDNQPALALLWRTRFPWKLRPRQITGDAKYGAIENVASIEREHIHAYVPLSAAGHRPGLHQDTDFLHDSAADAYRCPGNETLRFISQCGRTRRRIYAAPATACRACALKTHCTTSARGRRVRRSLNEDALDRVRASHATQPSVTAMRKRKIWVEPLFAEAKDWHGVRRFRLRGLAKVNGEAVLTAAGQNLKRLLSWHGWGPQPWPSGAAGLALTTAKPIAISPW